MTLLRDDVPMMTVEAFLAFTDTRPDEERWELIDGEPILSPSPSYGHQRIVRTLVSMLAQIEDAGATWQVLPGLGAKLSENDLPVPDVLLRQAGWIGGHHCDDMIVAFEVLSPSSIKRDLIWKRRAYTGLPSLQHYVVLSQDKVDVRCYDRSSVWAERRLIDIDSILDLHTVSVGLDLERLYRGALP